MNLKSAILHAGQAASPTILQSSLSAEPSANRWQEHNGMFAMLFVALIAFVSPDASVCGSEIRKLYWTDTAQRKIQRSNLDGTGREDVHTLLDFPFGLAIDRENADLYWSDSADWIRRSDLDGMGFASYLLTSASHLEVDSAGGKLYWTNPLSDSVQRANLDGSEVEHIVTGLASVGGIALELESGKVYWTNGIDGKIQRSNLDGSDVEDVLTNLATPFGLDVALGKLYWTDLNLGNVHRANVDGTQSEMLIVGTGGSRDIVVDDAAGKMYWTRTNAERITQANLDGSGRVDVVLGIDLPRSLALGPVPEPSSLMLICFGGSLFLLKRPRSRPRCRPMKKSARPGVALQNHIN